ncbi:hypothetical protein SAMD00024442_6_50 [Candidatus Symbiothrix dinenymphae]|nr:hypothetical protein SAMD00024442_6_50 [Candidatus Symbiothrix dinenymphae]
MKTKNATAPISSVELTAPRSWSELTPRELLYVSWLMTNMKLTPAEFQAYAFVRFTGITVKNQAAKAWRCRLGKTRFNLSPEQVLSFCKQMEYLTTGIDRITPLPILQNRIHVNDLLYGVPFNQYLFCENNYQAFIHTKEPLYLQRLAAGFYTNDDEYTETNALAAAKEFAEVPFYELHTVFLWYYGLKSVFQKRFPHFFQKVERILEDDEPQAPNFGEQSDNMVRALTGGDITKNAQVYASNTWDALAELDAKAKENKELEARMNKLKIKN